VLVLLGYASAYITESDFKEFIIKHDKQYKTKEERGYRFNVFKANMEKVQLLKSEDPTATYGATKFADMTEDEFQAYPCGGVLSRQNKRFVAPTIPSHVPSSFAPPDSFDWATQGAVTPVKDQGQCGSCWAFSTIGNIEGAWFLANHPLTSLSESELVDCSSTDLGCSGGWPFWALEDIKASPYNGRIATEQSYSYVASNRQCAFKTATVGAQFSNYTNYCNENTAPCTEEQIQNLLMTKGPLSVCLNANPMQLYTSGVSNPSVSSCNPNSIDHCVTMVGWGTDPSTNAKYWRIKNSWATSWGEKGFYRLIRNGSAAGACGINKVVTAVTI